MHVPCVISCMRLGFRQVRFFAVAVLCTELAACANEALLIPLNWAGHEARVVATADLAYGTEARQRLDIYRPATARNAPLILFWYGGSWQHGAKDYYGFVGITLARQG